MRAAALLLIAALGLALGPTDAHADWGAFYQGSPSTEPRKQATSLSDMTGMHPRGTSRTLSRMSALPAQDGASGWTGSYTSPGTDSGMPLAAGSGDAAPAICVAEILRAQTRYGIPDNILLGIGLQEAGTTRGGALTVWPWAVNAAGIGRIFDDRAAAMGWVRERQAAGITSIDVGCMQINLHWHPSAFASLEQGFDPVANVDYAARFLSSLYAESGSWMQAAGAYHSRTPDRAEVYLAALRRNVAVANDRIDSFHRIAGGVQTAGGQVADVPGVTLVPVDPSAEWPGEFLQEVAAPVAPWDHGHWSTRPSDAGGVYGIYSRAQLEPVLPHFIEDF